MLAAGISTSRPVLCEGTPAERNSGDSRPSLSPTNHKAVKEAEANARGFSLSPVMRNLGSDLTSEDNLRMCHILHCLICLSVPGATQQPLRKRRE